MIDYVQILLRHYDADWTLNGDDYEGLVWLSDSPKPTKKELDDKWDLVQEEMQIEAEAKIAKKKAAEAKLTALGLTTDDLKVLGLA